MIRAPRSAPQKLPKPPMTTTIKESMMTSTPAPGVTVRRGAAMAPARPPMAVAAPKTAVMMKGTLEPSKPSISRSIEEARTILPVSVFARTYQARRTTARPTMMIKMVYDGTTTDPRLMDPISASGLEMVLYSGPQIYFTASSRMRMKE